MVNRLRGNSPNLLGRSARKERFDILYQSLIDIFNKFDENGKNTLASVVIAIGFVATSDTSRVFFATEPIVKKITLGGIIVVGLVHILACVAYAHFSRKKLNLLKELNFMDPKYYEDYLVRPYVMMNWILVNLTALAILFVMIAILKPTLPSQVPLSS